MSKTVQNPDQKETTPCATFLESPENPASNSLEQTLSRTCLGQFSYWWKRVNKGRRAGDGVGRMWTTYPFGALLLDESWAWWSVMQVMRDGQACAEQAGVPEGFVVASNPSGVAVLCWPDGASSLGVFSLVSHHTESINKEDGTCIHGCARADDILLPERFLHFKGFDNYSQVVACAYIDVSSVRRARLTAAPSNNSEGLVELAGVVARACAHQHGGDADAVVNFCARRASAAPQFSGSAA